MSPRYPRDLLSMYSKDSILPKRNLDMFIAALFTITRKLNQPRYSSTAVVHMHMGFYLTVRKNKVAKL